LAARITACFFWQQRIEVAADGRIECAKYERIAHSADGRCPLPPSPIATAAACHRQGRLGGQKQIPEPFEWPE
jgi:hypothetical protein